MWTILFISQTLVRPPIGNRFPDPRDLSLPSIYPSYAGAALTSADSDQLQAVLECSNVRWPHPLYLYESCDCHVTDTREAEADPGTTEEGAGSGHASAKTGERGVFINEPLPSLSTVSGGAASSLSQVEEKVTTMQRRYFLQEQLKIIKRELGLEVCFGSSWILIGHTPTCTAER